MNKKLHFKWLLLLLMLVGVGTTAWAEEVIETITLSEQGYENAQKVSSTAGDVVTLTYTDGGTATAYYDTGSGVRVYNGGKMTVTAGNNTISKVVVTYAKNNSPTISLSSNGTTTTASTASSPALWEGSATAVDFNVNTKGHARIQIVEVTYTTGGGVQTPLITANDVDLAYNATSGSIAFTLTNPVDDGEMRASTNDTWITQVNVGEVISFTCTANEANTARTATVTLTYSYGGNETVTKDVTITQAAAPVTYTTIPDLFADATDTEKAVYVTFNNWVVSGVSTNGKNIFVTDNNGNGFVIYYSSDMSGTYSAGKVLSGTAVSCTLKKYNGFAELLNVDANDLTISDGGTVTEATVAMADLAGVNTGALVSYENLTCSIDNNKYYLSDGTTTLQVYNGLFAFDALESGKTYNITGIYQQYNNTKEILPRSAADIEEVVSTEPSIAVSVNTIEATADGANGTITVTYNNITEIAAEVYFCAADGNAATYDWLTAEINNENNVEYVIEENDGEARTAYMKVYALDDNTEDVYSELITITQAAYVAPFEPVTYTLATTITSGKHYIITNGADKAMGLQNSNNRAAADVEIENGVATVSSTDVYEFVIQGPDANGKYTIFDITNSGYLYAASNSSNHLKNEATLDNNNNGKWSIDFDGEGVATIKAKGSNSRNWMRYNPNNGNPVFSCYGSGQQDIYLYEKYGEATPTETVTISDAKYATYCSENALDFEGTGLTAYIAKMNGTNVEFKTVTKVPAYSGVLLKAETAGDFTVNVATTIDNVTDNAFIGVIKATTIDTAPGNGIFVLMKGDWDGGQGVGFYKTTGSTFNLSANTAYIPALQSGNSETRNFIALDEATAIKSVENKQQSGEIYNLAGQRVKSAQKGLYIIDGKKVVIK